MQQRLSPLVAFHLRRHAAIVVLATVAVLVASSGCAGPEYAKVRSVPKSPLVDRFQLTAWSGPKPSERTVQLLRRYALLKDLQHDPGTALAKFQQIAEREPSAEKVYALAELSFLCGKRLEHKDARAALNLYGVSVAHSYMYLFDEHYGPERNPYDPQFREVCDLYNGALESALRIVKKEDLLTPGCRHVVDFGEQQWEVTVVARNSNWHTEDFGEFKFVSDYEVSGLTNQYQSYGLGVPLIAIRRAHEATTPAEGFYPPSLSFPVTAFMRLLPDEPGGGTRHRAVLELYDPLLATDTIVSGRRVPLESDVSTPLAYFLNTPDLNQLATYGLLRPDKGEELAGLYMLQPYQPGKIPVVMVHGLWSSPLTWMEMFNDLRGTPEIRDHYQFWFYLYPTGQPFWTSAARMRSDLAHMRQVFDPQQREPALDQMVLVGHSMGGLVAKLQTLDSGNDFWGIISDKPFYQVKAEPEVRDRLASVVFFQPNPSIRRVITIGTPHRGSKFANAATRRLAQRFITLPAMFTKTTHELESENPGLIRDETLLKVTTSLDSLAPDSPVLPVMLAAHKAPWVKYHNIVGLVPDEGIVGWLAKGTDGVVSFESAHLDDVESEIVVRADHTSVHSNPQTVLEVRRILLEHLAELEHDPNGARGRILPVSGVLPTADPAGRAWVEPPAGALP